MKTILFFSIKMKILEWNGEDYLLYTHFNKTFWKRVQQQDQSFWDDVIKLQEMSNDIEMQCKQNSGKSFSLIIQI